jgi:Bacterial type II/III secretion system short domain
MTAVISYRARRIVAAMVCLTGSALLVNALFAQPPQKNQSPAEKPPNEVFVVPLRNAAASEVSQALSSVFSDGGRGGVNISVDQRTNAIIIVAPAGRIAEIKDLISKLDVQVSEPPSTPRAEVRIFSLRNSPDKSVQDAVKLVLASHGLANTNVAIDSTRNQVIVSADKPTLDVVQAILARLDTPLPRRPSGDLQLRVVWLVKGSNPDEFGPPPEDLKEVLTALAKIGIDKPRLAAQTLINMTPSSEFRASGTLQLGNLCQFSVSGHFSDRSDPAGLNISLNAKDSAEICNISTEISAPIGHFVVLGVTPTRSMTSVFVVQVLAKETIAPQPAK